MRLAIQEVEQTQVTFKGEHVAQIGAGIVIYVGISKGEGTANIPWLMEDNIKTIGNHDSVLLLSQFTLFATFKTNKPSFHRAECPAVALEIFDEIWRVAQAELGDRVKRGLFGKQLHIEVSSRNSRMESVCSPSI